MQHHASSSDATTPPRHVSITDEASPFALRSTRNRLRTALHRGCACCGEWRWNGVTDWPSLWQARRTTTFARSPGSDERSLVPGTRSSINKRPRSPRAAACLITPLDGCVDPATPDRSPS
jgi:hypothetical protein